jgi:hypothetical protein
VKYLIKVCFVFIAAIYILVSINVNFGKNKWQDVLESDAWGYYAYLPAVFIYHDLHFTFYDKIMHQGYFEERLAYDYRVGNNGLVANKYFCGTALAISPFFLGAHALSSLMDYPLDGYQRTYILSVNMAAVFYTVLGLFFLLKLLKFYTTKKHVLAIVIVSMAFGTQLFYYSIGEPGMSHVYSFCFVSLFLWKVKTWFENKHENDIVLAAIALGVIFLIRPINVLVLLVIPFIAASSAQFANGMKLYFKQPLLVVKTLSVFLFIASIQSVFYYLQTGKFWVDSYPGENFNFLEPHIFEMLFSFKKGFFIYTPLLFIGHFSLWLLFKENRFMMYSYLLFFLMLTYILSSWWIWYYGGSFSMRPLIEYFSVFAVLLTIWLDKTKLFQLKLFLVVVFIVLCQIQTYQYRYFIIHWSEMDQSKYFNSIKNIFGL